jgi:hypothetical protein
VLEKTKIELRMNLSLLKMLKGNTLRKDLANVRERCFEPLETLVREMQQGREKSG